MNVKRILLMGLVGGAAVTWFAGASTSISRTASPVERTPRRQADLTGEALAAEIARLHERLRPTATPLQVRDLFRYASREAAPSIPRPVAAAASAETALVAAETKPMLRLVGVAEEQTDGGLVRTAIVSGDRGQLFFAKEGDTLLTYRVRQVLPEALELVEAADDSRVVRLDLP